jgi:hypothetical protein
LNDVIGEEQYYSRIFHETLDEATQDNAIKICTYIDGIVGQAVGQYGSVNLGNRGEMYTQIRTDLMAIYNMTYIFPSGIHYLVLYL